MTNIDYSKLVFDAYLEDKVFFSKQLLRESEKADKHYGISVEEFFYRCQHLVNENIKLSIKSHEIKIDQYNQVIKELEQRVLENYSDESVTYAESRLEEVKNDHSVYLESHMLLENGPVKGFNLNDLYNIKENLNFLSTQIKNKNFKNIHRIWFRVGLALANGRIFKLVDELKNPYEIAKELFPQDAPDSYRVYIYSSLDNLDNDKNIFDNFKKMKEIVDYCEINTIPINPTFIVKYNKLKADFRIS